MKQNFFCTDSRTDQAIRSVCLDGGLLCVENIEKLDIVPFKGEAYEIVWIGLDEMFGKGIVFSHTGCLEAEGWSVLEYTQHSDRKQTASQKTPSSQKLSYILQKRSSSTLFYLKYAVLRSHPQPEFKHHLKKQRRIRTHRARNSEHIDPLPI